MSLFGRSSSRAQGPATAPECPEVTLVIERDVGRVHLFAWAEKHLPEGLVLAQVKDLSGERRAFRTTPTDPRAKLVAREVPVVLRGGLTSLVSYYVVPADALDAREEHLEHGAVTHHYDVKLRVVGRGAALETATAVPA